MKTADTGLVQAIPALVAEDFNVHSLRKNRANTRPARYGNEIAMDI